MIQFTRANITFVIVIWLSLALILFGVWLTTPERVPVESEPTGKPVLHHLEVFDGSCEEMLERYSAGNCFIGSGKPATAAKGGE